MDTVRNSPRDIARAHARRKRDSRTNTISDMWKRQTYRLPRLEARAMAREWFGKYPKAAYMTEIEFWRELADGDIEFTIRRLPSAD